MAEGVSWSTNMQEGAEVRHGGSEFNVKVMEQEVVVVVVMEPTGGGSSVIIPPLACLLPSLGQSEKHAPPQHPYACQSRWSIKVHFYTRARFETL